MLGPSSGLASGRSSSALGTTRSTPRLEIAAVPVRTIVLRSTMAAAEPSLRSRSEQVTAQVKARWLGGICLLAGLAISATIFSRTEPTDGDPDPYELNAQNSKKYEDQLERIGGKGAVLGVEIQGWWDSLWHGRQLAYTVLVLTALSSGACFLFSQLEVRPADSDPSRGNGGARPPGAL